MLSLVIISALLLPSVLGNCCTPNSYECIIYRTHEPNRAVRVLVNFEKMRILQADVNTSMPVEFELLDVAESKQYIMMRNGHCSYQILPAGVFDTFKQCTKHGNDVGSFTMGNGVEVVSYEYLGRLDEVHVVYSKDKCLPMVAVRQDLNKDVTTTVFGNMKYTEVDDSDLDLDLSQCVPVAEEV